MYNVIIIGMETCRKDALQCYNPVRNTPNIQEFANRSLVFDNYVTIATNTYQSWGCLLSGKYPDNTGISTKPKDELNVKLMFDVFLDNGYYINLGAFAKYKMMGSDVNYVDNSLGGLREPFFVFVANMGAHYYYGIEEKVFRNVHRDEIVDAHARLVEGADGTFGQNINKYLKYKNTIIIFTADHGDKISDGYASHHDNIDQSTTDVPFIVYHPEIKPRRISDLFSSIDIFPTLIGLCEILHNEKFDGVDLSSNILNSSPFPDRTIQIGPSATCKDIRCVCWGNGGDYVIRQHEYSRKEVLIRYKDYKDRQYVNKLFEELESKNYFSDNCVRRSEMYDNLSWQKDEHYISRIVDMLDIRRSSNVGTFKIIDAGTGTGTISKAIVYKLNLEKIDNTDIYAIDQCYSMLSKMSDARVTKYVADIENLMFISDNSIDRIVCRMVLHSNYANINMIMKEFWRVLKDDGILVISEDVSMNSSIVDFYRSFLTKAENRCIFTTDDLVNITKDFQDIQVDEIILKQQSIRNWLHNSCVEKGIADNIFDVHRMAPKDVKEKINMIEEHNDIFCDWKFAIVKCRKYRKL